MPDFGSPRSDELIGQLGLGQVLVLLAGLGMGSLGFRALGGLACRTCSFLASSASSACFFASSSAFLA